MKKNLYGNIEDIVQNVKIVTSIVSIYLSKLNRVLILRLMNGQESVQGQISITSFSDLKEI
jgi:hypothetical protein